MNYNLQKLEEWYQNMSIERNFSLHEAQEIYKKMISTSDYVEKKKWQDELILGTIHVLYRFLANSYLPYFPNGMTDVDDVISVASELWIEFVLSAELLNISFYNDFFRTIFGKINTRLYQMEKQYSDYLFVFEIGKQDCIKLLINYLLLRSQYVTFSFQDFTEIYENKIASSFYCLFENIYKFLENQGLFENKNISVRQLHFILPSFLEQYIYPIYNMKNQESSVCKIEEEDKEILIENEMLKEQVIEMISKVPNVSSRDIEIFYKRLGMKGYSLSSLSSIAMDYQISPQRVKEIEKRVCKKLKEMPHSRTLKKILQDISFD